METKLEVGVERPLSIDKRYADWINAAVADQDVEQAFGLLAGGGNNWRLSLWQTPENRSQLSAEAVEFLERIEAEAKMVRRS